MYTHRVHLLELIDQLKDGKKDLMQYVDEICDRMEEVDPHIHAFLPEEDRRARLRKDAKELQARYPDPSGRPPLFGVPVGVKDLFKTRDLPTRAGSKLPPELFSGEEAECVSRLRDAGCLVLGKTHMGEFAYTGTVAGPALNPHNTAYSPGGSSGGSAAAVAAGLCPIALGTQTVGSVTKPAAFCGIVGFKPSRGRISGEGVVPCSKSLDQVGLLTQDVESAELAASVICKYWHPQTVNPGRPTLGVPEDGPFLDQVSPEGREAFASNLKALEQAGYTIKRVPLFENIAEIAQANKQLMDRETADVHTEWLAKYEALYHPDTVKNLMMGKTVTDQQLASARAMCSVLQQEVTDKMHQNQIDMWLSPPVLGPAPLGTKTTGNSSMNMPWTYAGLPIITVPVGKFANGLPVGLQMIAEYDADEQLLFWAKDIEKIFQD